MGYASDSNFDWLKHTVKGFTKKHLVAYAESHDEERMMYKNLQYGASSGTYNVKDLKTSLERQKALGAVLFTIPGPKMLWQFGELGYDYSINHCQDETNSDGCRTNPKPIPSEIGYLTNTDRKSVYDVWAKIIGPCDFFLIIGPTMIIISTAINDPTRPPIISKIRFIVI